MGRPPLFGRPMTAAERQRRVRGQINPTGEYRDNSRYRHETHETREELDARINEAAAEANEYMEQLVATERELREVRAAMREGRLVPPNVDDAREAYFALVRKEIGDDAALLTDEIYQLRDGLGLADQFLVLRDAFTDRGKVIRDEHAASSALRIASIVTRFGDTTPPPADASDLEVAKWVIEGMAKRQEQLEVELAEAVTKPADNVTTDRVTKPADNVTTDPHRGGFEIVRDLMRAEKRVAELEARLQDVTKPADNLTHVTKPGLQPNGHDQWPLPREEPIVVHGEQIWPTTDRRYDWHAAYYGFSLWQTALSRGLPVDPVGRGRWILNPVSVVMAHVSGPVHVVLQRIGNAMEQHPEADENTHGPGKTLQGR